MRNIAYGALCGVLVFLALSWARATRTAKADVLAKPPEGRFQLVQLHPSHAQEWSGVLDTETGCVWVYTSQTPPASHTTSFQNYQSAEGSNFFGGVNYDTSEYAAAPVDYLKAEVALSRVQALCDHARVQALEAAAGR